MKTIDVQQLMEVAVVITLEVPDDFDITGMDQVPCTVSVNVDKIDDEGFLVTKVSVDNVYTFDFEVLE